MSRVIIRPARTSDPLELAPRTRQADIDEVLAISGRSIDEALIRGFYISDVCWAVEEANSGGLLGLFGVAPSGQPEVGTPWMLCAEGITRYGREYFQLTKGYVALMHQLYPVLFNIVDARNSRSIRWLQWAGFEFPETVHNFGPGNITIHTFMRIESHVRPGTNGLSHDRHLSGTAGRSDVSTGSGC